MKDVMSIRKSAGVSPWMFVMPEKKVGRQVIWIRKNWGDMVPIAAWGGNLENHDGTCDYEDMNNQTDIAAYKVFAKDNIVRKTRKRSANL